MIEIFYNIALDTMIVAPNFVFSLSSTCLLLPHYFSSIFNHYINMSSHEPTCPSKHHNASLDNSSLDNKQII